MMTWKHALKAFVACSLLCALSALAIGQAGSKPAAGSTPSESEDPGVGRSEDEGQAAVSGTCVLGDAPVQAGSGGVSAAGAPDKVVLRGHPSGPPASFDKDGLYIWRDPDDLWTIFWRATATLEVSATLSAKQAISVEAAVGAGTEVSQETNKQLEFRGSTRPTGGIVQFRSADAAIEIDILLNGKPVANQVYLGALKQNPQSMPFTLDHSSVHHGSIGQVQAADEQRTSDGGAAPGSGARASPGKTPPSRALSTPLAEASVLVSTAQNAKQLSRDEDLRISILESELGREPVNALLDSLVTSATPQPDVLLALLVRKDETLPHLLQLLQTGSPEEQVTVLLLLQKTLRWPQAGRHVLTLLTDPDTSQDVRLRAAATAATLGIVEAGPVLLRMLQLADDADERELIAKAVGILRYEPAISILKNTLADSSQRVRLAAASALGRLHDASGLAEATDSIHDEHWFIRKLAVEALGSIANEESQSVLNRLQNTETSPFVQAEIRIALSRIALTRLAKDEQAAFLISLLDDDYIHVRRWARKHLCEHFPQEAVPAFSQRSASAGRTTWADYASYLVACASAERRTKP